VLPKQQLEQRIICNHRPDQADPTPDTPVKWALGQVRRTQADGDPNVPIIGRIACVSRRMGTCPCMNAS
jgi:hypothetical protein